MLVKIRRKESPKVSEYALNDATTIDKLLEISGLGYNSSIDVIFVNGYAVPSHTKLYDKNIVVIERQEPVNVFIGRLRETLIPIKVQKGAMVRNALEKASRLPRDNEEVWVHYDGLQKGNKIQLNELVNEGMILVVEEKKLSLIDKMRNKLHGHTGYANDSFISELITLVKIG